MAIKFLNTVAVDTNVLYVDADNNRVGIGDTTPSYTLDVNGTIYGSTVRSARYYGTSGTSSYLDLDSGAPYSLLASSEVNVTDTITCNDLEATETGGIAASNGPVYANRFHGNGNTTYYVDPNDGTQSAYLNGQARITGGITTDGNAKSYTWRALNNTSNSSNQYYRIAKITASQSSRFIIELAGRSTSYTDGVLPAFGKIVGQLNNDNNYDIVYYNASATDEVVDEVGQVDVSTTATDIYIRVGTYAELVATGSISDGTITTYGGDSSSTSAPTGYVQATEYKLWNAGNDGSGSGLDADTLDGQHASAFLTAHPSISAASSSNNSGRTYIQDITLDSNGHVTGIATATETVTAPTDFVSAANGGTFSGNISVSKSSGDAKLIIEADTDNNNENDNPVLELKQDGGAILSLFGINGDSGNTFTGAGTNYAYWRASDGLDIVTGGNNRAITINNAQNSVFHGNIDVGSYHSLDNNGQFVLGDPGGIQSGISMHCDTNNITIQTSAGLTMMSVGNSGNSFTGTLSASSDMRAPIFYDSDNTGFYFQPESTSNTSWRLQTPTGYLKIGSRNTSYVHFYTDRGQYYFDKGLTVDTGQVKSYNEDLNLNRAGSTTARLRITSGTTISDQIFESASGVRIGGTATANELDDYEEGTYNIGFSVGGTTYAATTTNFGSNLSNQCKYVKVGRIVTIFLKFQFSAHPSAWTNSSTLLYMTNLPFTPLQGTLSGGCMFSWIEHSVVNSPSSSNLYRFPDDYGHVNIRQGYSSNLVNFYRPNNVTGYYSYFGESSMLAGDWPGNNPSGYNYLTGAFTYYTTI